MGRLDGDVAIVTGAAQGIGLAYAKALAEEGAKVTVCDILDCTEAVNSIVEQGGEAIGLHTDVADEASTHDMVAKTVDAFGKLDILVNNAALFGQLERKPFTEIEVEEWDRVMAINVRGPFLCAKAATPAMRKNGYGKIINISSSSIYMGHPYSLHYACSKGALVPMTRSLAKYLGDDGICVNTVAPGLTMSDSVRARANWQGSSADQFTQMRAIKREQLPEDLIGTVVFLASHDSDFVTGQSIIVDGGCDFL